MDTNTMSEQKAESGLDLRQQVAELQNKYCFQLLQNNSLLQQNKQLRHELNIAQLSDISFSEYSKSMNILMHLILSPVTFCNKLTTEDWKQLFNFMDILYGSTLKVWLEKYNCLSEEEIALCYFCYIGIKHSNLSIFFGISPQSLSKRKQRLKNKLTIPKTMSLEDFIKKGCHDRKSL